MPAVGLSIFFTPAWCVPIFLAGTSLFMGPFVPTRLSRSVLPSDTHSTLHDVAVALNCVGRVLQLDRAECFTQSCRALFPGDKVVHEALQNVLCERS